MVIPEKQNYAYIERRMGHYLGLQKLALTVSIFWLEVDRIHDNFLPNMYLVIYLNRESIFSKLCWKGPNALPNSYI